MLSFIFDKINVTMKYAPLKNYINGKFVDSASSITMDVISPIDGNLLSTVPMSSAKDMDDAVKAAKAAFPAWSKTPIKERVQVFFRYKYLLEQHLKELAELCSEENGKTCTLSLIGVLLHVVKAALAAFTASSISFTDDIGTVDNKLPSIGEITSIVLEELQSTNFPLI